LILQQSVHLIPLKTIKMFKWTWICGELIAEYSRFVAIYLLCSAIDCLGYLKMYIASIT